ncbi:MAG: tetratricopeptide repeat protein [Vicinamibacterales bacterium]
MPPVEFAVAAARALAVAAALVACAPGRMAAQSAENPVTFAKDVAPILFKHCASCHQPGGHAPFSVLTYGDVRPRAARIAAVVQSRQMPPWKPDPGIGDFIGVRRLNDVDILRIARWVRDGALEGNPADLPVAPRATGGWQLGAPDLILRLPAYELSGREQDQFRNFVVDVPGPVLRYVRGLEFHPNSQRVHHANIFVDPTTTSRQLDDEDPRPGYEGVIPFAAAFPDGHFLGWTPGQLAPLLPAGQSWRLPSGATLLVQMHLNQGETPETVEPTIGLYFTEAPPVRPPAMLRLGRQNLDITPGDVEFLSTDSFVLPVDAEVQAVQPHAHHRARSVKAWATLPDGRRHDLIAISDWDFGWQDQYRFVEPLWLPKGTTLSTAFVFDNSAGNRRNPDSPPRRVVWGQRSSDEMADVWVQMLTRSDADLVTLGTEVRRKMVLEDIAGHEIELRSKPDSVIIRNDVAVLYLEAGRPAQAAAHFAAVARLQPQSAAAQYNLAAALGQTGRTADAIAYYALAVQLNPSYLKALKGLATALLVSGRRSEALARFQDLVVLDRSDAEAFNNLGFCQLESGDLPAAIGSLEKALALRPAYADAHFNLARVFIRQRALDSARAHLRAALEAKPDWVPALTELAWLEATAPDRRMRDAQEAVRLATRAVDRTTRQESDVLAALAAALAAAGQFDHALRVIDEAIAVASPEERRTLEVHRGVYRSRQTLQTSPR